MYLQSDIEFLALYTVYNVVDHWLKETLVGRGSVAGWELWDVDR